MDAQTELDDGVEVTEGAARDRAHGLQQRGIPVPTVDPEADMPKAVEVDPAVDRSGDHNQVGVAKDPHPVAPASGLSAESIAEIAYGAVQMYKELIGESPRDWFGLDMQDRVDMCEMVSEHLQPDARFGPSKNHARWQDNMMARGGTIESDPRLGVPWGDLPPSERRKGALFCHVVIALVRSA